MENKIKQNIKMNSGDTIVKANNLDLSRMQNLGLCKK